MLKSSLAIRAQNKSESHLFQPEKLLSLSLFSSQSSAVMRLPYVPDAPRTSSPDEEATADAVRARRGARA